MLETVREYALERLEEDGRADAVRARFAEVYVSLAEAGRDGMRTPEQKQWLERLDAEHPNLHAAAGYALAAGEPDLALRMCDGLWRFWVTRGHISVGRRLAEQAIAAGAAASTARVGALSAAGILAAEGGDQAASRRHMTGALELARELGDEVGILRVATNLGTSALYDGDPAEAGRRYAEALEWAIRVQDAWSENLLAHNLASAYEALGDVDRSVELLRGTVSGARELGDGAHLSSVLRTLGRMLLQQGARRPRGARDAAREPGDIARDRRAAGHRRVPRVDRGRRGAWRRPRHQRAADRAPPTRSGWRPERSGTPTRRPGSIEVSAALREALGTDALRGGGGSWPPASDRRGRLARDRGRGLNARGRPSGRPR